MKLNINRELATLKRRKRLKAKNFSIISNTCIGGVISNSLGEQQRSPTVNLVIYEDQFLQFCRHLKEYARCPLEEPNVKEREQFINMKYPVGIVRGGELPDINVYFIHYASFAEAKEKWEKRFSRVNYDNLYFLMDRGMDARDGILDEFHALPYPHKVFFTHKEDPDRWPNTFRFSYYTENDYREAYMYTKIRRGLLEYRVLDEFDYVQWLNDGTIQQNISFCSKESH